MEGDGSPVVVAIFGLGGHGGRRVFNSFISVVLCCGGGVDRISVLFLMGDVRWRKERK